MGLWDGDRFGRSGVELVSWGISEGSKRSKKSKTSREWDMVREVVREVQRA